MSDAMFSIDLDVSRALAAQQRILDGWDKVAIHSATAAKAIEPMGESLSSIDKSVNNLSQKGLSSLERQITKILAVQKELKKSFVFDSANFYNLENSLSKLQVSLRSLRQDLAKDITPKFNVQSVSQFEEAIGKVQTRLKNLEYVKAKMNPIDYASFKASYAQALAGYQTALRNTIEKATAFNSKNKGMFDYLNTGSYQMTGFAGKQQVSSGITSGLNNALQGMRGFNSEAVKVQSSLDYINKKVTESQNKLTGFSLVIKRVFEYGLVYRFQNALLSLPSAFYEMNSAMEKFAATYRGIFGETAAAKMEYVKDAANKYGMDIISLADSYKKFSVTLDELGVAGTTTDKIFESFTEGLKKAGATSTDSENAFRALIQMYSKGVVSAEEFTRQLSQYIPAANAMAARSIGVTTAEFKKMMAAGQVIPDQFIPEFTKQMKIFGLGWEESAKTMESSVSRMKNSLMELTDSKAFQESFSDTMSFLQREIKQISNFWVGATLADKGELSFWKWLGMGPDDLDKFIKEYDKKMSTLDGRIAALREKREKTASTSYMMGSAEAMGTTYDPQVEKDLQAAESEKWTQQLKSALKNVTNEYLELQRKFKEGDLTAEADLNFNKEKMMWLLDTLNKVAKFDGKSWLATIDIDTSSVTAALNAVERLFGATREGRIESANASYESANKRQQTLQQELDSVLSSSSSSTATLEMVDRLKQGIYKAGIEAQEAKENVVALVKTASSREVKELGDGIFTGNNAGKGKSSQILQAQKDYVTNYNKLMAEYKNGQGTVAAMSPSKFGEVEKKGLEELEGKINQINKQGAGGENAAKRAAIATDKYTESIENLLKKEFALAQDNPLDAAFASIDEKVNSLTSRMEELALKSGSALKDIPAQIAQFKELARGEAVDKQLENLFPWMKHEKEVVVLWDMLGEKWKYASAEAKKHGMAEEELTEKIYNLIAATQQLNKEQKAAADADAATNFKDYAKAMQDLDSAKYGEKGSGEKEAIKEFYETYITLTKGMTESRLEMYRRVAEQAKANGMDEAQAAAYVQSKWQEAEVERLEAIQKYGSASEAFSARLAQNFETYKDAATKSRESAVQMADSISNMADTISSGVGQAFGDMFRNIGNGTASIEDLWKNMLARMLDALASFIEEAITKWTKDLLGGLFSGSGSSGGGISSLFGGSSSSGSGIDLSSIKSFSKIFGKESGEEFADYMTSASSSTTMFMGSKNAMADIFSEGLDTSNLGKFTTDYFSVGTEAVASTYSGAEVAAMSGTSMLGTVGSVLGVVGAIGGIVGLVSSLFGEKKEEVKKVASGYNVGYNAGHSTAYGVDFYSNGSVQYSGPSNPDVQKKISDAFRNTAESLQDFAEELGFAVDVLEGFQMPNMNITDDQLDGYIRNGENMMAFKGLMESGMRGAFDYVARDGEVYVDEYERLATSLSTVRGGLEAYGYELSDVAMITQNEIDLIRAKNTEVAEGTAQAMQAMAASMGATDDVLAQIAKDTPDATAALAATDEQLSTILEADYASDLIDAVGGEDAFDAMMGNLTKNVFKTVEAYAENLDYYTEKANTAINKLGDASVTVDNFWIKFDEAIKQGLTVDEFEAWGKASTWVNQIDTVNDLVEEWDNSMTKFAQSLDARMQAANGLDYQAELTQQLAAAEWELYEARKAGYDSALIARLQEVQAAELAATKRKHQEDYNNELLDAQERIATANDDKWGLIEIQRQKNALELSDMAKTYNWSPGSAEEKLFQTLQQAQQLEIDNMVKAISDALEKATTAMNNGLDVREAKLAGNDDLAEAISMSNSAISELQQAYDDGLDEATIARLISVQNAEMEAYLASIDSTIKLVETSLSSIMETLVSDMISMIDKGIEAYTTLHSDTSNLADRYHGAADGIYQQLKTWGTDDVGGNPELTFKQNQAVFDAIFKKAMTGDIDSLENLSSIGSSLLTAAQGYYGNKDDYLSFYRDLQSKMGQAAGVSNELGDKKSDLAKLYEVQLNLYELLKDELSKEDPNTALLEQIGVTMSAVQGGINTGNTYQETLRTVTQTGTGGYKSIIDAIGANNSSLATSVNTMSESQTKLMELLERYLNASQRASLESKMSLSKTQAEQSKQQEVSIFRNSKLGNLISSVSIADFRNGDGRSQEEALLTSLFGLSYTDPIPRDRTYLEYLLHAPQHISSYTGYYTSRGLTYNGSLDWEKMYSYLTSGYYNPDLGYDGSGYNYVNAWSGGRHVGFQNLIDYGYGGAESISPTILTAMKNTTSYWAAYKKYEAELTALGETTATAKTLSASTSFDAVNGSASTTENASVSDVVVAINDLKLELETLRSEVKNMRAETNSANMNIGVSVAKTASILTEFKIDGMPKERTEQ